jgi:hypothetical protein
MKTHGQKKRHHRRCHRKDGKDAHEDAEDAERGPAYAQFLRTFIFGLTEPILQPNGFLTFPDPAVRPQGGIEYVDDPVLGPGLRVRRGVYLIQVTLNPGGPANLTLLVNGQAPVSLQAAYPFTQKQVAVDSQILVFSDIIRASSEENFIQIQNTGSALCTLRAIPNTQLANVSLLTQVIISRIA